MKNILLIIFLAFIAKASSQEASCRYVNHPLGYICFLTLNNSNGSELDEITGDHLEGFTNEDVIRIYREGGMTTNVPQRVCLQFPNLVRIDFAFFGITTITENSFSNCRNVDFIRLWRNQITEVPENAFANNPNLTSIDFDDNNITTLPENIFSNLVGLINVDIRNNPFEFIPGGLFNGLVNLQFLFMSNVRMNEVNPQWLENLPNLEFLWLYSNRITSFDENLFTSLPSLLDLDLGANPLTTPLPANLFQNLPTLLVLFLDRLGITDLNPAWFAPLPNLEYFAVYLNNIDGPNMDENTFANLTNLVVLDLDFNSEITDMPAGIFRDLRSLRIFYGAGLSLRTLHPQWFATTLQLELIELSFNRIEDLPPRVFENLNYLTVLALWGNDIKTIEREYFGNLNSLFYLDLDENAVNGLDERVFNDAFNLRSFYFIDNVCASGWFDDFILNREQIMPRLDRCFRNFLFMIETVTEGDDAFRFYRFPQPGIFFRVEASQDVHISLNPVNFEANPRIEILIGVQNNMRSQIIRNGDQILVDIATPNILSPVGWNGFRVVYANFVVLVYREDEPWPFMGVNMVDFIAMNFYGIRTPGSVSPWSILPLDADGTI